jgi:DHA1 family multidrug resistance protein-like MFS transporter
MERIAQHADPSSASKTDVDLENGRRPRPRQRTTSSSNSSSDCDEEEKDHDGHRPTRRELYQSISRSRSRAGTTAQNRISTAAATSSGMHQPLSRTLSRRDTVLSRIRTRPNVAPFTHPLAHEPTTADVIVDFEGPDDPYRPMNWPIKKKITTTLMYGLTTMSATWASSAYSAGTRQIAAEFHVGNQVAVLGTTLFLFGFGLGPLLWAPLSEVYGRRVAVLTPMFIAICFSFGSAVAKDFQTLMITRFFGAFFASAPVTNTGGVLGDLFNPTMRGLAMAGYAMAVVGGPCLGK